jgi:hypothetical protein
MWKLICACAILFRRDRQGAVLILVKYRIFAVCDKIEGE